jgi:hypothetical protein
MEFYSGKYGKDKRKAVADFGQFDTIAYTTGDILSSSAVSFGSMARAVGMSGNMVRVILKETLSSGTLQKPSLRLWFFGASVTPAARNSPQAFTSSQLDVLLGVANVLNTEWIDCGTGVASLDKAIDIPYVLQTNSSTIFCVPEVRAAYTFNSTDRIVMQLVSEVD